MSAALSAREQGASVCIVTKQHPLRSHSSGAQSGINAGLRGADAWESHGLDTVKAGAYLSDQDVVESIARRRLPGSLAWSTWACPSTGTETGE